MGVLFDAHTHWTGPEDLLFRRKQEIFSMVCAQTSSEYIAITSCLKTLAQLTPWTIVTAGLHPWHCEKEPVEKILDFFPLLMAVGEIGMDSVWCKVDLKLQQKVFLQQLEYAAKLQKPVILHTKGQEDEIASIIQNYPNRYLVHWYSCNSGFRRYEDLDCWFTVAPDVLWNETTQEIARKVRSDRILFETDGMEAVQWAYRKGGIPDPIQGSRQALLASLLCCARLRNQDPEELSAQIPANLRSFLGISDDLSSRLFPE